MIITLVGSTKFPEAFNLMNMHLSAMGHIVLSVGMFSHQDMPMGARAITNDSDEKTNKIKQLLDSTYLKKIEMSDAIMVINPCGYIGEGAKSEIRYAELSGKKIMYMFGAL